MTAAERWLALIDAWIDRAEGDLRAARACLAESDVPAWVVGFHLQQAVEKSLKGLIVLHQHEPPRLHQLDRLADILSQAGGAAPFGADLRAALQPFAVEDRYPVMASPEANRDELARRRASG
jgi:HEPN domain-containing protein